MSAAAWFAWVGTQPALGLLNRLGIRSVYEHDVALANRFRAGLGLAPADTAIVRSTTRTRPGACSVPGCTPAERGGRLRVSCHVCNSADAIDAVLDALTG